MRINQLLAPKECGDEVMRSANQVLGHSFCLWLGTQVLSANGSARCPSATNNSENHNSLQVSRREILLYAAVSPKTKKGDEVLTIPFTSCSRISKAHG
jgi:hypothetical protein